MKPITSLLICTLFLSLSVFAQQGNISGEVLDAKGELAMYANIILHNPEDSTMIKGAVVEEDGRFQFNAVPFENYFLSISYVGFAPYQSEVFALNQENLEFPTINLAAANNELAEITITAQRPMFEIKSDKTVFNVEGTINASGENGLELLRKAPGVTLSNDDAISLLGKSGVRVYIDGKESPLSGDNLVNFLRSLQADQIDAIELITNPTAEYDAEGSAGIINFRLKKDVSLGFNTGINLNYSHGLSDRYAGSINTNYRNKKFNIYATYEAYDGENTNGLTTYRETPAQIFEAQNDMLDSWTGQELRIGGDWFVNEKNTIGLMIDGYVEKESEEAYGTTDLFQFVPNFESNQAIPDSILISESKSKEDEQNLSLNLNYEYKDEKKNHLTMDFDAGFFHEGESRMLVNTYHNPSDNAVLNDYSYENNPDTDIQIYTGKVDYKRPLLNGNFGAGIKASLVNTDNLFSHIIVEGNGKFIDFDRSNHFTYKENVNAAYFTYAAEKDKFSYNFGLRAEQTNLEGILMAFESSEIVQTNKRNYIDFFPSAGLSYQINDKNGLSLNYSRRINRPSYQDLNPFEFKIDELTFEKGNPFLKSEYANNIQLRHSFMQMVNTTLAYSHTNNVITQILDATEDNKRMFITQENLATQDHFSINISSPIPITDWWSGYTSITAFHIRNRSDFGEGKIIDLSANTLSFYMQNSFTLPLDFSMEVSGWYNSKSVYGNIQTMPQYGVDLGLQKKVLNGKGKIKMGINDVFKTNYFRGIIEYGDLYSDVTSTWDSHRYKLGFSYLFGNDQVKVRNRSAGSEAESNRIK